MVIGTKDGVCSAAKASSHSTASCPRTQLLGHCRPGPSRLGAPAKGPPGGMWAGGSIKSRDRKARAGHRLPLDLARCPSPNTEGRSHPRACLPPPCSPWCLNRFALQSALHYREGTLGPGVAAVHSLRLGPVPRLSQEHWSAVSCGAGLRWVGLKGRELPQSLP